MSNQIEQYKSRLREALGIINGLKARIDAIEDAAREPIAIVGYGCRFPGGNGVDAFWQVLDKGIDAVREIPDERWPANTFGENKPEARWAALLDDLSQFDAAFFSISPREAESLDPQQRMLLEVSWEALEHAGQRIDTAIASRTGVFVGICSADYQQIVGELRAGDFDAYCGTGNTSSAAAGRISYSLGFQGPAISLDTACSSSLAAVSEACLSLRSRHCDMALAGGVNAILSAQTMALLVETQALSADGRCKSFDARANGFVRGEGCGIVVLKRLSDAIANGDRVYGVIRSWVINQDGRSTGLTTPNVLSQKMMLQEALERARLSAGDIDFIETHGTGTSLGDPIEAEALIETFGTPRTDGSRCFLGAVKTNIGHLEGAAGVAGLIKILLAIEHQRIPKNLHFKRLNPRISLEGTPLVIPNESVPWRRGNRPRRAGISAFGISGTNVHLIVEEPSFQEIEAHEDSPAPILLPLSAKSASALTKLAQSYVDWLPNTRATLQDIAYTASARRVHHDQRLIVVAETRDELTNLLSWAARGDMPSGTAIDNPKIVFVFPGQGSQWVGMGRQLLREEPVFRETIENCSAAIQRETGYSVLAVLSGDESQTRFDEIDVIQPVLFAIEVALATLWQSWGLQPHCVIGHSMGEVAAAHVAGILTLDDAAKVICRRSRLLRKIRGQGSMALVELPMAEAEQAITKYANKLGIAVSNGPRSTVLSGDPAALGEVLAQLEARNIFCRRIKVDVASHSPQVDVLRDDLLLALEDVRAGRGIVPMKSTVTGEMIHGPEINAAYWVNNLRQPVRFSTGVQDLIRDGHTLFIEMSPHPILLPSLEENLQEVGTRGVAIPSMRREAKERRTMLESLGLAYMHGAVVDWEKLYSKKRAIVNLPAYPWQHERFWVTPRRPVRKPRENNGHLLLGTPFVTSTNTEAIFWRQDLTLDDVPYLAEHKIGGQVLFPGAGYIEVALAAAREHFGPGKVIIEQLTFLAPLILIQEQSRRTEVFLERTDTNTWRFRFSSMNPEESTERARARTWTVHAEAFLRLHESEESALSRSSLAEAQNRCSSEMSIADILQRESNLGFEMGPVFRGLNRLARGSQEVLGRVDLPASVPLHENAYSVHPALLDAALRAAALAIPGNAAGAPRLLTHIRRFSFVHSPGRILWSHAFVDAETNQKHPSITLFDENGRVCMTLEGFETRIATGLQGYTESRNDVFIAESWTPVELPSGRERTRGRWLIFADDNGVGERIREHFMGRGNEVVCVWMRNNQKSTRTGRLEMDPSSANEMRGFLGDVVRGGPALTGIVHCWGIASPTAHENEQQALEASLRNGCASALHLAQILTRMAIRDMPRSWILCRGSQAIDDHPTTVDTAQALLWGLGRTIALEYPELKCTRVDLDPQRDAQVDELIREFSARDNPEDELAYRGTQRFAKRLIRVAPEPRVNSKPIVDARGSYLVTGGMGGMGLLGALWLARAGAREITLLDLEEATSEIQRQSLAELANFEVDIRQIRADVTNRTQLAGILGDIERGPRPLRGILHCAGFFDSASLTQRNIEQIRRALLPQVLGGLNLHLETLHRDLDFLIFSSTIHTLLGSANLGGEVMGNVFLQALAMERRRGGRPSSVIHWGPFDGVGIDSRLVGTARKAQHGMDGLSTDEGAGLFLRALRDAIPDIGVAAFDLRRWLESHPQAAALPRLRALHQQPPASKNRSTPQDSDFLTRVKNATPAIRVELVEQFLRQQLATILRMEPSRIDRVAPLRGLGIDSLMSLELRNRLEATLAIRLSATIVWSYPTIELMGKHIADLLIPPAATTLQVEEVTASEFLDAATLDGAMKEIDESSLQAVAEDHELFNSFDHSIERMRRRRKS